MYKIKSGTKYPKFKPFKNPTKDIHSFKLICGILTQELNQLEMKKNLGLTDRIIRVFLAAIIATLFIMGFIGGVFGFILLLLSGILLLTTIFNFCPIYKALGFSSNKKEEK